MNKKHGALIAASVAAFGAIASIGVSFALYKKVGSKVEIGIGTYTPVTDAFVYRIGTPVENIADPVATQTGYTQDQTITFDVGGQYPTAQGVIAQNFYVGNLTVDVYSTVSGLTDKITVTPKLSYKAGSSHAANAFWKNALDPVEDPASGHKTYKGNIAFATGATNDVDVEIKLSFAFTDAEALSLGGSAYKVDITFAEANENTGFNWLYIRGDANGWDASNDYRLVPNLGSATNEFMFNGLTKDIGEMKIATKDWSTAVGSASGGGNLSLQYDGAYEVYWHGEISGNFELTESHNTETNKNYVDANLPKQQ